MSDLTGRVRELDRLLQNKCRECNGRGYKRAGWAGAVVLDCANCLGSGVSQDAIYDLVSVARKIVEEAS